MITQKIKINRYSDDTESISPYRAIAFDLGDTLVQHKKVVLMKAAQNIQLQTGIRIKVAEIEKAIQQGWSAYSGTGMDEQIISIRSEIVETEFLLDFFKTLLEKRGIFQPSDNLVGSLAIMEKDSDSYKCLPGVHRTLKALKEKHLILILISNALPYADGILIHRRLARYFDHIILSYRICAAKPGPKIYEEALQRADLLASSVLFIDNNVENVRGAFKVGMQAVWFNPKDEKCADWDGNQIRNIKEVTDLIEMKGGIERSKLQNKILELPCSSSQAQPGRVEQASFLDEAEAVSGR